MIAVPHRQDGTGMDERGEQPLQPLGFRHLQTALLRLPLEKRRLAEPVLAADLRRWPAGILLAQDSNDLLLAEPALLHVRLIARRTPT